MYIIRLFNDAVSYQISCSSTFVHYFIYAPIFLKRRNVNIQWFKKVVFNPVNNVDFYTALGFIRHYSFNQFTKLVKKIVFEWENHAEILYVYLFRLNNTVHELIKKSLKLKIFWIIRKTCTFVWNLHKMICRFHR